jgi:hypothetical protein
VFVHISICDIVALWPYIYACCYCFFISLYVTCSIPIKHFNWIPRFFSFWEKTQTHKLACTLPVTCAVIWTGSEPFGTQRYKCQAVDHRICHTHTHIPAAACSYNVNFTVIISQTVGG